MTIGAVSSYSYSYATSTQYQYFGTVVSNERIQELMDLYGIKQTGDSIADLERLYKVMYSDAEINVESANTVSNQQISQAIQGQNSTNIPWATLMSQVGLYAKGDFEADYEAFKNRISAMQLSAISQQEKASINQLVAEASIVFVPPTTSSVQISSQIPNASQSTVSGADILAQLNKMFIYG